MATTEEGLRVRIGVPVAELRKDIAATKAAFSDLSKSVNQESSAIDSANKSWNQMGKFIFEAQYQRRRMIQQVNQGVGAWKLEAKAVEEVANKSLPALQRGTRGAASTLTSFSRIVQDAPYGIIGIGNNITQFAEQFQYLRQNTGSAGGALKALGSSLIGAGGLTLGISLLITGITTLTQKYGSLGNAVNALLKPLAEQQRIQKEISDTLATGAKNAQAELVKLDSLYRATQNINLPLSERNKLIDELQKRYPKYFKNLSNESIAAGNAATAYLQLRDAILAKASAEAIQDKVKDIQGRNIDLLKEERELREQRLSKTEELLKAEDQLSKLLERGVRSKGAVELQDALTQRIVRLKGEQSSLTKEVDKNKESQSKLNSEIDRYLSLQDQIIQKFGSDVLIDPTGKDGTKKAAGKTVQSVLKELAAELKSISLLAETTGAKFDSVAKEKISALQKAFEDLIKLGLKPTSPELKSIVNQINTLSSSIIGTKGIQGIQLFTKEDSKGLLTNEERILRLRAAIISLKNTGTDPASESIKKLETEISALKSNTPLINVDNFKIVKGEVQAITPALQSLDSEYAKFVSKTKARSKDLADDFKRRYIVIGDALTGSLGPAIVDLQQLLQRGISNMAVGLGESIGDLITGKNGLASVFGGILGLMGDFIKEFGQSLITAGTLRIIAEKTLLANPYLAIAAGIAAVAAGTALKNKVPSFATGGVVTEPQLAMIGDNPGRQEHIIPSEVMDKLGASNSYPSEITLRAHGSDLVGVLRMGQNYNGRING